MQSVWFDAQHLTACRFFTDDWDAFAKVLPARQHRIGKNHTVAIEHDHSNTCHHLGRFTRRTQIVSKKDHMIDLSLRLWQALSQSAIFTQYQKIAFIYK